MGAPDRATPCPGSVVRDPSGRRALMLTRAAQGEACLELVERPPPRPLAHLGGALRRDEPGPSQEPTFTIQYLIVLSGVPTALRRLSPVPIMVLGMGCRPATSHTRSMTLVRLTFFCRISCGCEGSRGLLRTSGIGLPAYSHIGFALSRGFFSPGRRCGRSPQAGQMFTLTIQ